MRRRRDVQIPEALELLMGKDQDKWPEEARFIVTASFGDVRSLKEIAKSMDKKGKGIEVTVANTNFVGTSALHAACESGNLPVIRYLVEELNMDINKADTMRGQPETIKFLLSKGVRDDSESSFMTPLELAAFRGYPIILKMLLEHGADPNKHILQFTPLEMALSNSSVPCVKLLVQAGADVNGSRSFHPLAKAAEKGLTEAIKCLVEAGANANVPDTFGRLPIELAAEYGTWEDVEILFPVTSAIPTVPDWSVHGIISHVYMEVLEREDPEIVKKRKCDLKRQAGDAFRKQDYLNASVVYTQALKVDHFDGILFSNRSLCWLRLGEGEKALDDAMKCVELCPKWGKAYYRKGAALMHLKEYESAYNTLSRGLELNPESEEMEKLFWEAMDLK
ncbi:hypothetical protein PR202_gb07300 [Eleusine coracana subsp. coracana]|uniref:Uncharacterized protein n=1 Tax=Eleusine coracana subsp. coracana TaxID=191504 RepID=A0AAV5E9D3_ELECO|nr:hypothetical protein PR202_gb07300 [Eleusine coracana subsp. coracana]